MAQDHSASNEVRCFYGTRRFVTVFTKARYWILSRASSLVGHRYTVFAYGPI